MFEIWKNQIHIFYNQWVVRANVVIQHIEYDRWTILEGAEENLADIEI